MPVTCVLIPFRADGEERTAAFAYVLGRWCETGWRVSTADDGDRSQPWNKARAVANAHRGTPADVYVVADADCFVPDRDALAEAVDAIDCEYGEWAMPHGLVRRLSEAGTRRLIDGSGPWNGEVCRGPYYGFEGGGMTILTAQALKECPLDPRFEGWGNEDEAWGMALRTLYGAPWRGDAQLVHLWHPPAKPNHRKNYEPASVELLARYRQASKAGPDAMRELLAEMRAGSDPAG